MLSEKELYNLLVEYGLDMAGPLVSQPAKDNSYIAFIKIKVDKKGQKSPGSRALSQVANLVAERGYILSFVTVDEDGNDFDGSLKSILFAKFGDSIRNSFASFTNQQTEVWIEPKAHLSPQEKSRIQFAISEFSALIGFELVGVSFTDSENTPTPTAILSVLRTKAPCSAEALRTFLKERGLTVPNVVWLNHALDRMRKAELVVRSKNGDFFVSFSGLSRLGTAKSRQSPDILRALDFAKRRA
ncbi:hypothetical protein CHU95_05480 [Niveispirillum lacus]|uniref:Uncharacterized protein n=1 Tax=Niveispirillum lacus TaxID=1981099 RepID=A0A255Z6I0_9PROT|nr:hypothetical protein [Niveispirillum lacus]OYQ36240.1 hypothetical protein CHU95_05480 [Niveispirillum lacus]